MAVTRRLLEALLLFFLAGAASGFAGQWIPLFGRKQLQPLAASDSKSPQQVHISMAGQKHIKVTWIMEDSTLPSRVDYGTVPGKYTSLAMGDSSSYFYMLYRSGMIHNVVLGPLEDDTVYYYQLPGTGPELSFKTPPPLGRDVAVTFVVVGDLGQTKWSESTLSHIEQCSHDVLVFPGDLSYADYYQPLWDSFGRLVEDLASSRPWMVTQGNHEMERIPLLAQPFKAYNARWSMPYKESNSASNLFYSFEVGGVHVLMLGSYTDYNEGSDQYQWLERDLKALDRNKTPWLVAVVHAPWYSTNNKHRGDGDGMRNAMESLLYRSKVDIVFSGHVHAYERTARMYKEAVNDCGMIHITIGDGGNREGLARSFRNPKPEWSLYREASFGHGELRTLNATHARWSWQRNDDEESVVADDVYLTSLSSGTRCARVNSEM